MKKLMKNALLVLLSAAMLLSVTACHGNNASSGATGSSSSAGTASGNGTASGGTSSGVTVSGAVSRPPVIIKKSPYVVKTVDYKYDKNNRSYRASYPQLSSKDANYNAVNDLLKKSAMQTISSLGTSTSAKKVGVKVSDHVSYKGDNFLSVTFRESVKNEGAKDSTSTFRTVNYDLKNKKVVSVSDMIQKNSALLTAVQNAVKKQMTKKKAVGYTQAVLQSGIKSCSIYFKDDSLGISIPVSHALDDHKELIVDYDNTSGFRTGNVAWNYFIKSKK